MRSYGYATNSNQQVYSQPVQKISNDNATIAIILGVVGFAVSCVILPILGLHYVQKAEARNEEKQMIMTAKILNWIQLILWIIGIIALIVAFSFSFGMYW